MRATWCDLSAVCKPLGRRTQLTNADNLGPYLGQPSNEAGSKDDDLGPYLGQGDDPRIVLRDPAGVHDQTVEHPGQPRPYLDKIGTWEQVDQATNWRQVGNAHLRVYDLVASSTS